MVANELTLPAQTTFAQVCDAARAVNLSRSVADLSGHFAKRTIKGRQYWYFRYRDIDSVERMSYVGPDSDELRALIEKSKTPSALPGLKALANAAIDLGCAGIPSRHYRVISRLSEFGFFRAGGVLVGTHAFLTYGNMLGIRWGAISQTHDVDFAHAGRNLAIALPADISINVHSAIGSLEAGFIPIMRLSGKAGATYRHPTDAAFQIDFLTTRHRGGDEPFEHPKLGVVLQPLRFLEYVLEDVVQSAVISEQGAAVVNLPAPARYAVHKMIVAGERFGGDSNPKRGKDLDQARALIACIRNVRPDKIESAWADVIARGPGWAKRARTGLAAVDAFAPELGVRKWLDPTPMAPPKTKPRKPEKRAGGRLAPRRP